MSRIRLLPDGFAALLAVAALIAPTRAVTQQPEVVAVRFPGASAVPRAVLLDAVETRPTRCRSPLYAPFCALGADWSLERGYLADGALQRDAARVRDAYEAWGRPGTKVDAVALDAGAGRVAVEYRVAEAPPIVVTRVELRITPEVDPPLDIDPRRLPLRVGEAYALPLLHQTEERLRVLLAEHGHPYARLEVGGDVGGGRADVVLTVDPGPLVVFGEPRIAADPPIRDEAVRERLAFQPGERYRPSALLQSEVVLHRMPIVGRAGIDPADLRTGATVVRPIVRIEARRTHGIELEGTISSVNCLELAGFWQHRYPLRVPGHFSFGGGFSNLLAQQLDGAFPCRDAGVGVTAQPNYFVQSGLRYPLRGRPSTTLMFDGDVTRRSAPRTYVEQGVGGRVGVAQDVGRGSAVTASYIPRWSRLVGADIYFCASFGICEPAAMAELSGDRRIAPVELTVTRAPGPGLGGPILQGWRGWARAQVQGAGAATGSTDTYARGLVEAALARGVSPSVEIATRARAGALAGDRVLPPQVRLYGGGPGTVRGVPQNLLGPTVLFTERAHLDAHGCASGCPPGTIVDPRRVFERAAGGDLVADASIEARLALHPRFQLAGFVDAGVVRSTRAAIASPATEAVVTPGVGARLLTRIGPVRLDVACDPRGTRTLPLFTRGEGGELEALGDVIHDPVGFGQPSGVRRFLRRLEVSVGLGQAF